MAYVDELERQLRDASRRRLRLAAARAPRPPAGAVGACVSIAVCLLVALLLLRAHRSQPTTSPSTAPGVATEIVANFQAFRRARSSADAVPVRLRPQLIAGTCTTAADSLPNAQAIEGQAAMEQVSCLVGQPQSRAQTHQAISLPASAGHKATARARRAHLLPIDKPTAAVKDVIQHLDYDQSRKLVLPAGRGTIWLIPAGGWLCDLARSSVITRPGNAGFACEPVAAIVAKPPLWPGGSWNGVYFGVEPDSITRVEFARTGAPAQDVELHDHTIAACVGTGGRLVQYSAKGSVSVEIPTSRYGGGGRCGAGP
jgi:hypothetical protein